MVNAKKTRGTPTRNPRNVKNTNGKGSKRNKKPAPTSRRHDGTKSSLTTVQKVILVVIGLAVLLVVLVTIFAFNFDTKYQVEAKISDYARDYYETYYYSKAFDNNQDTAAAFLADYQETGLAPVTLRQMLLSLPDVTESDKNFLRQYCNENATAVRYYPEAPYAADNYRAELNYSCDYE